MVQADAVPDAGKGISRKIQVRNGRHQKTGAGAGQIGQLTALGREDLPVGHALHGLLNQPQGIPDGLQVFQQRLPISQGIVACLGDGVGDELLLQCLVRGQNLCGQILQIDDLCAAGTQQRGKFVVLLLGPVQVGNVVKQQLLHGIGAQMLQLPPGTLQQHLLQWTDLTFYTDGHPHTSFRSLLACKVILANTVKTRRTVF